MTKQFARCTKHDEPSHRLATNNGTFLTCAIVVQEWRVDNTGEFIECTDDCSDVYKSPDEDTYDCAVEGCEGTVEWIDSEEPATPCTCEGVGNCAWCNTPCGTCGGKRANLPLCECEDGPSVPTAEQVRLAWMRDGLVSVADDPNLGLLMLQWQMRHDRLNRTLNEDQPRPSLLAVIQRWLWAGCPDVVAGPNPLEMLGLIKLGDGETEDA